MNRTTSPLLVVNVGSSSVKVGVFDGGVAVERRTYAPTDTTALAEFAAKAKSVAVGHRVVHGGTRFVAPVRITDDVLADLDALAPFAPLHLPPALAAVRSARRLLPSVPHVACFDTAFHATLPPVEQRFGLPRHLHDEGVRRYGFHGLSYESIASQLPAVSRRATEGRTVVCHLGSGASLCGMLAGRSVTTTMGFSPLDGLLMATRCGRIDPGVVLYLLQQRGMTADQVRDLLMNGSGLLGVSGVSGDMRALLADPSPAVAEAVELYCYVAAKEVAAATVALGGLDAVVFTAGVGEHSPEVRRRVCEKLGWLGVELDLAANADNRTQLHTPPSRIEVFRLPTDEEAIIARHTAMLLAD